MILERETIETRKIDIQGDIEKLRETISQLDTKRQELVNNLNALSGAEQQCDHFLSLLEQEKMKTFKQHLSEGSRYHIQLNKVLMITRHHHHH